ncbi:hypothetical protein EHR_05445 [Enterococcus hirae ATCC 9790]|uniref:Uncharacterized protein n=1 Tax=Enterococcus hirae (strain ATCC 9790 / DSM 20160 / JCM 8729 / LMG 6399 / NBRC 3181 / NCIMB 6459 / NCDO 1258 / NCTC 12367 / WDCM 00089 / R) TaxID=768486 RepID=I6SX97_ENTHA|nr:hypothetical protein EHR_05445 [Enterococcus hirae ATCC 9790]
MPFFLSGIKISFFIWKKVAKIITPIKAAMFKEIKYTKNIVKISNIKVTFLTKKLFKNQKIKKNFVIFLL